MALSKITVEIRQHVYMSDEEWQHSKRVALHELAGLLIDEILKVPDGIIEIGPLEETWEPDWEYRYLNSKRPGERIHYTLAISRKQKG